jgi:hypothetical protein
MVVVLPVAAQDRRRRGGLHTMSGVPVPACLPCRPIAPAGS